MQKINLIAQSVPELSHRENLHNYYNNDDTHQGWIIVFRRGRKKWIPHSIYYQNHCVSSKKFFSENFFKNQKNYDFFDKKK